MLSAICILSLDVNADSGVFEVRRSATQSAMPRAIPLPPEELAVAMERGVALFERLSLCPAPDEVQSHNVMYSYDNFKAKNKYKFYN